QSNIHNDPIKNHIPTIQIFKTHELLYLTWYGKLIAKERRRVVSTDAVEAPEKLVRRRWADITWIHLQILGLISFSPLYLHDDLITFLIRWRSFYVLTCVAFPHYPIRFGNPILYLTSWNGQFKFY
ncbi:hypothetical protein ACJX0J_033713, partial [Zea mays]